MILLSKTLSIYCCDYVQKLKLSTSTGHCDYLNFVGIAMPYARKKTKAPLYMDL